jgi:hypothetical protein
MPQYRQSFSYRDWRGRTAHGAHWLSAADLPTATTDATAVAGAVSTVSNAALISANGPYSSPYAPASYGNNTVYPDVEDQAVLFFATAGGGRARFAVFAPKTTMFLADGETVNSAQAGVAALITALNGVFCRPGPDLFSSYIGGRRMRSRNFRRRNVFTLTPTGTPAGE